MSLIASTFVVIAAHNEILKKACLRQTRYGSAHIKSLLVLSEMQKDHVSKRSTINAYILYPVLGL